MTNSRKPVLEVRELSVGYGRSADHARRVVHELSFSMFPGQVLGLAGESGCGKSTAALAAVGYAKPSSHVLGGESLLDGEDILKLSPRSLSQLWGNRIAYVPQSAAMSLNPGTTIGRQLAQPLKRHQGLKGRELKDRQVGLLQEVGLPNPIEALERYSFQFSGGQQQRISLAIALSCSPDVLVLDEPTTGLDVTTQARITSMLRRLVDESNISALYISHDLALLSQIADDMAVMYSGEMVERGTTSQFVASPRHPYTQALFDVTRGTEEAILVPGIAGTPPGHAVLDSCAFAPRCRYATEACTTKHPVATELADGREVACINIHEIGRQPAEGTRRTLSTPDSEKPMLSVDNITFSFPGVPIPTLQGIGLYVGRGEQIGIVGESGSGKSTLLQVIAGLAVPSDGSVSLNSEVLASKVTDRQKAARQAIQLILQNPDSSLNPRQSIASILTRPIRLFRDDISRDQEADLIAECLEAVRLPASYAHRYPRELSGGQRQRVSIARAFAARPQVLLCDEITSALDVSVQATVLELLADLSERTGTGVIFVGHDLAVVRTIANRTIVMSNGEIVEEAQSDQLFSAPAHPYTQELVSALPSLSGSRVSSA